MSYITCDTETIDFGEIFSLTGYDAEGNVISVSIDEIANQQIVPIGSHAVENDQMVFESKLYLDVTFSLDQLDQPQFTAYDQLCQNPYLTLNINSVSGDSTHIYNCFYYDRILHYTNPYEGYFTFHPALDTSQIETYYNSSQMEININEIAAIPIEMTIESYAIDTITSSSKIADEKLYHDALLEGDENLIGTFAIGPDDTTTDLPSDGDPVLPALIEHLGLEATEEEYGVTEQQGRTYLSQGVLSVLSSGDFKMFTACQPGIIKNVRMLELTSETVEYYEGTFWGDWSETFPSYITAKQQIVSYDILTHTAQMSARIEFNLFSTAEIKGTVDANFFYFLLTLLDQSMGTRTLSDYLLYGVIAFGVIIVLVPILNPKLTTQRGKK